MTHYEKVLLDRNPGLIKRLVAGNIDLEKEVKDAWLEDECVLVSVGEEGTFIVDVDSDDLEFYPEYISGGWSTPNYRTPAEPISFKEAFDNSYTAKDYFIENFDRAIFEPAP